MFLVEVLIAEFERGAEGVGHEVDKVRVEALRFLLTGV
jgi:hypothetical protein